MQLRPFAAAALGVFVVAAAPAAACSLSALTLTCAAPGTFGQQSSALSDLVVIIENGATVQNGAMNTPAFLLSGNNVRVENYGTIRNPNTTSNNANNAIQGTGAGLVVINSGLIESGDRGIHVTGGTGGFLVENAGTIRARRQAVRTENSLLLPGSQVLNRGTIESQNDRAIQLRGRGAIVVNAATGVLSGGDEVVEARDNFTLFNSGTIRVRDGALDADGVQFASGSVMNFGLIEGSDDGIDLDEGLIYNGPTGIIRSRDAVDGAGNGIDIDEVFDNGVAADLRPSGDLAIENDGLIEGPRAIGSDPAATNSITVINRGTLRGTSGTAIGFAPGQGASLVALIEGGRIAGDVVFGAGDDIFRLVSLTADAFVSGTIDGGAGTDTVHFAGSRPADLVRFAILGDLVEIGLRVGDPTTFTAQFRNFEFWSFGDGSLRYTTAELGALFAPAPVPLPAGLGLLLAALGGLAALRRRG